MKIILIIVASLLVLITVLGFGVALFFYNLALSPNSDKSVVMASPNNELPRGESDAEAEYRRKNMEWLEGVGYEEAWLDSYDGLKLHSYIIKNAEKSHKWVIAAHGYTGRATNMINSAVNFYEKDFNILMPDARGHGDSEGDYIGMGWHDRLDMVGWINHVVSLDPDAEIILYGVSMGGATVMMTAGEKLPPNVKAVVEDCGYTSAYGEFSYQLKAIFGLPPFPIMNFSSVVAKMKAGYTLEEASAVKQLEKAEVPILFIHGDQDTFVPFYMLQEVYDAANVEKEMLVVEGAWHGGSAFVAPELFWSTVFNFIGKYTS